jgi:hypothetical protein
VLKRTAEGTLRSFLAQYREGCRRKPAFPLGLIEPPTGIGGRGCRGSAARQGQQTGPQGLEGKAIGQLPQEIAARQRPTIT